MWFNITLIAGLILAGYYIATKNEREKTRYIKRKGIEGERAAHLYLEKMFKERGIPYEILTNVLLEYAPGRTTEIDLVCVTSKGIFVIEMKNYIGCVTGVEDDHQWIQKTGHTEPRFYPFYNPVRQNQTHINTLKKYLNIPMYNCVLFGKDTELHVTYQQTLQLQVHTLAEEPHWIQHYLRLPDILSPADIQKHVEVIKKHRLGKQHLASHVQHVRRLRKKS